MHKHQLPVCLTLNAGEYNSGVIIGNDISIAVLWFVDLQVGVLPRELLTGVDGLQDTQVKVRAMHKYNRQTCKNYYSSFIMRSFRQSSDALVNRFVYRDVLVHVF